MRCMGSQKIENFLDWMREEGLLIHYHSTDVLYWSIVDIIDTIGGAGNNGVIGRSMGFDMAVKSALYDVLRADLPATTKLLHGFNYPDVGRKRQRAFLEALIVCVMRNKALIGGNLGTVLLKVLRDGQKLEGLPLLEGRAGGELIDRFMDFYLHRIALFNNAWHILDDETEVEQALSASGLNSAGRPIDNYRFGNSKAEPGIQASDVVAGIMGKLFNYVIRNTTEQVRKDVRSANSRQARNLTSLRELVDSANSISPAFAHTVISLRDRDRAGILLD